MGAYLTYTIMILISIALLLAGCGSLYTSRFHFFNKASGDFVNTSYGPIHVVKKGQGHIPVVFVHGNLGTHLDFTMSPLEKLLEEQCTVYALDRPGAGFSKRSSDAQMTLQDHADAISEVIQELGIDKPLLIGHSYGGGVSLMYALRHPELLSGLLLISPAAHDWEGDGVSEYPSFTAPILGPLLQQTLLVPAGFLVSRTAYEGVFAPASVPEEYFQRSHRFSMIPDHFAASARDMQVVRPGLAYIANHYHALSLPVAVLSGAQDTITPYWNHGERLDKHLPQGYVQLIPEGGHQLHFSHPEEVLQGLCWLGQQLNDPRYMPFCSSS